ncbi:MAG: PIN domain-containing protein [Pirellulales bacterium]|nr:PIN domain-containing protein [Pirellulales bacterium]
MKIFFDTNVYVAEALLGGPAEQMIAATIAARWRMYSRSHLLEEAERVLVEKLGLSTRLGRLTTLRIRRRSTFVNLPASRHEVSSDPADSPILQAALTAGVDFLVTNDKHLLELNPYESLRIISMTDYFELLGTQKVL